MIDFHVSKSALGAAARCGQLAWWRLHDRRPPIVNEAMAFGSAVDQGIQVALTAVRAGIPYSAVRDAAAEAAVQSVLSNAIEVDLAEAQDAIDSFVADVVPLYDFRLCAIQEHVHCPIEGLGECVGYLDIRLADDSIWDTKTSTKGKPEGAAYSVELGFYTILYESASGRKVPRVGYWTRVRSKEPKWQTVSLEVTDEFRRWAYENAAAFVRGVQADELLNRDRLARKLEPVNYTFTSGPKWDSACRSCEYAPANGGRCRMARSEELR